MWRHQVDPLTDILVPTTDSLTNFNQENSTTPQIAIETVGDSPKKTNLKPNMHKKRIEAFSRTKPWRTFELSDQIVINHENYNEIKDQTSNQLEPNLNQPNNNDDKFNSNTYQIANKFDVTNIGQSLLWPEDLNINAKNNQKLAIKEYQTNDDNKDQLVKHTNFENSNYLSKLFVNQSPNLNFKNNIPSNSNIINFENQYKKFNFSFKTNNKSNLHRRFSLVLYRSKELDVSENEILNSNTTNSKNLSKNLNAKINESIQKPGERKAPIRRRRTLKNLETAKYRVLAAEMTHRMVIERTSGATTNLDNENTLLNTNKFRNRLNSYSKIPDNNENLLSINPVDCISVSRTNCSEIAKVMNETAAMTIAPVDTNFVISIPMITVDQISETQNLNDDPDQTIIYQKNLIPKRHGSASQLSDVIGELLADKSTTCTKFKTKRRSFKEIGKWSTKFGFRKFCSRLELPAQTNPDLTYQSKSQLKPNSNYLEIESKSLKISKFSNK